MMKKFLTLFMSFLLFLTPFSVANAYDSDDYVWGEYTDDWIIADTYDNGGTNRGHSWSHFYTGYPAVGENEVDYAIHTVSYGYEASGTLQVPLSLIEAVLNITLEHSESFSIVKGSAPLKKGEYVKAYWRKYYNKHTVLQQGFRSGTACYKGSDGQPYGDVMNLTDVVIGTRTYEVWDSLQPQVKLEYYSTTTSPQSVQNVRSEIYTYIDGEYVLTDSYTSPIESPDAY